MPKFEDMRIFRLLNRRLQLLRLHHPCAHGGVPGRSSFTSAKRHLGASYVVTTDVKDCFPSVSHDLFKSELSRLYLSSGLVDLLADLFMCRNRIPQGCPTSNLALNLFFWRLDYWMVQWCHRHRVAYSRMVDDIVISGESEHDTAFAAERLHRELADLQLKVNLAKWASHGVQPNSAEQVVHSLSVESGSLRISSSHRMAVEALVESAVGACRSVQLASFHSCVAYRNQLHGWFYYIGQTEDPMKSHVGHAIRTCDDAVVRRLKALDLNCKNWKWWLVDTAPVLKARWQMRIDSEIENSMASRKSTKEEIEIECAV